MTSGALTSMTLKSSIHMCQTHYTQEGVLQAAPAQCADARADLVHGGYLRHARALDARHHAGVRDPDRRATHPPRERLPARCVAACYAGGGNALSRR